MVFRPDPLPSVDQLADSAALVAAVTRYAENNPLRDGELRALYSVVFGLDGRLERLHALDYWLPQGEADGFAALVRETIRRQSAGPLSVRLLVRPGAERVVQVGRSERCAPRSLTRFRLTAPAAMPVERPSPIRVRVHVGAEGRVQGLQMLSGSGSDDLDRWVQRTLQSYEFEPGLLDEVPVAMTVEETVQIEYRR